MDGEDPARSDGWPECGWYKHQFKRGGPWLPVAVKMIRQTDPITGELLADEHIVGVWLDRTQPRAAVDRIWLWLKPITVTAYRAMVAVQFEPPSRPLDDRGYADLAQEPTLP